ncbi:hypothetical protein DPMN_124751 [Dreissena polymorpha]|uniref:Uncharacterized protein n=1 Tax=Dreissena polymorpha TaxID=45954 RepID=A0A9D4GU40_DREPO|nr:hypothetical protein DPMN_124751 [Dreissena polymorpha]
MVSASVADTSKDTVAVSATWASTPTGPISPVTCPWPTANICANSFPFSFFSTLRRFAGGLVDAAGAPTATEGFRLICTSLVSRAFMSFCKLVARTTAWVTCLAFPHLTWYLLPTVICRQNKQIINK